MLSLLRVIEDSITFNSNPHLFFTVSIDGVQIITLNFTQTLTVRVFASFIIAFANTLGTISRLTKGFLNQKCSSLRKHFCENLGEILDDKQSGENGLESNDLTSH